MKRESAGPESMKERGLTLDEKIASLFQPDTLLSVQYYGNLRRTTPMEPEIHLTLAILEDAVNCFQENVMADSGKAKKLFTEAEEWILDESGDWIFSFQNVCELLGIDPAYLRQGLIRWKQERRRQHGKDWGEVKMAS